VHHDEGPAAAPDSTARRFSPGDTDLASEVATLRDAIATRTVIGQATGLLAGQLNITTPTAWRVIRRLSNETNIKLRDVARALVDVHDGRRPAADDGVARAIGAALGPALAAAKEDTGLDDPQDADDLGGPSPQTAAREDLHLQP
jgi:hypothetical protein